MVERVIVSTEDVLKWPAVNVDRTMGQDPWIRWDLQAARVDVPCPAGAQVHVASTPEGRRDITRIIGEYGCTIVFVGESGGAAIARDKETADRLADAISLSFVKAGALQAEVHAVSRGRVVGIVEGA